MAHLSPVNGAFPHKDQIDRSCYVAPGTANEGIERGHIICVDSNGEFTLVEDSASVTGPLYFALQPYGDKQAAMAGRVGLGKGVPVPATKGVTGDHLAAGHAATPYGQPKITGLSFQEGGNYQTDMYDHNVASYPIGAPLKVVDGRFTTDGATAANAVAYVYSDIDDYYFNGAELQPGWSTGAWIKVLRVSIK